MSTAGHITLDELEAGLSHILDSPKDRGTLQWIVRRPDDGQRETLNEAQLDPALGLVGDNWLDRGSPQTRDGSAHPEKQLNIMNARAIAVVARSKDRWALAGDQLYLDLDLSDENLPPGSRLTIGSAVIEITAPPHTGCKKFQARYGADAVAFVNSPTGKRLHLRGVNAKVIQGGVIRVGDVATKCNAH
jgi:MOSC domain-containing protein YiiM